MEWIYTKEQKPLTYITGDFDGKNSNNVVAEDKNGKQYLAYFSEGILDGEKFEDWYTSDGWLINEEIVKFLLIP